MSEQNTAGSDPGEGQTARGLTPFAGETKREFIPAARFHFLTNFYDALFEWYLGEAFRKKVIHEAKIQPDEKVLDVGCGTATQIIAIKKAHPDADIQGLDADENIMKIAEKKLSENKLSVKITQGFADEIPFPNESFHLVITTLMMHHLLTPNKKQAFKEFYRILKRGGRLLLVDFGPPTSLFSKFVSFPTRVNIREFEHTRDGLLGLYPEFMKEAGFTQIHENEQHRGLISFYKGWKL